MAPSTTIGAVSPSAPSAATNVVVFQWPCGTASTNRCPAGARPYRRVMFVVAQVSSMKRSLVGSRDGWAARQSSRCCFTSGRSCSAARWTFFSPSGAGRRPPATGWTGRPSARAGSAVPPGCVGLLADGVAQRVGVGVPTRLGAVAARPRRDFPRFTAALLEAADPGRADGVLGGDLGGGQPGVAVGEHALAQVHRVRLHGWSLLTQPLSYGNGRSAATLTSKPR